MRADKIKNNLINVIQHLYVRAFSPVYLNGRMADWFRTTVAVRQLCLLSPTLLNVFLERIITDALEDHMGTLKIGGRAITNLLFVDDADGLAGDEHELTKLVKRRHGGQ